jgi:release factor glutamine methyltransferase
MTQATASVREALASAVDALAAAGVDSPRLDAEVMLAEASGIQRAKLLADPHAQIPPRAGRAFGEMVRRRLRREPVAYILGRRGFRRIDLAVDRRVLVPRPETELLVELALDRRPRRLLEVGTGSGAVALAVADELPDCEVTATDTSEAALQVARANAERLGLAARVRFLHGSLAPGSFDLLLANLPYVAEGDWASLQPEIVDWEPREALLAGPDGLEAIRFVLARLRPSGRNCDLSADAGQIAVSTGTAAGCVAFEVGEGQAAAVAGMLRAAGFAETESRRDLAGIERVVVGSSGGSPAGADA